MDEKQSPDGSVASGAQDNATSNSPTALGAGPRIGREGGPQATHSLDISHGEQRPILQTKPTHDPHAAQDASPAASPSFPPFRSTPAATPPFASPQATTSSSNPQPETPAPQKFELTSLIKALPEPVLTVPHPIPRIIPPGPPEPHQSPSIGPAPASIIPQPPSAAPSVSPPTPAPNFTPFTPANLRSPPPAPASTPATPAEPAPTAPTLPLRKRLTQYAAGAVRFAAIAFAAWFVTVMVLIALFRFVDPPQSMLMLTQRISGQTLQHDWVPLEAVSTNLRRAVITSEDGKFCRHWGFDLGEIRAAMRSSEGFGRGASTITQQLAKNLFLWPGKSYVRKALEVPLTLAIEALWSKKRILEVYLNIAEWGPGVFGAQAAADYYYNKPASQLTEREAALLAVSLPNPIARDASDPNPAIARRAATLQARMRVQGISYCALTPKKN